MSDHPSSPRVLRCGDAIVGFVDVTDVDNFWTIGKFQAGPAYEHYALLLDRERELSLQYDDLADDAPDEVRSAAHEAWMAALEAVNELNLHLDGTRVRDFKLDSRGVCEFKLGW